MAIGMTNAQYLAHLEAQLPAYEREAEESGAHRHAYNFKISPDHPTFDPYKRLATHRDDIAHYRRMAKTEPNAPFKVRR